MMYRYYSKLRSSLCHSYKCNRQYSVSQLEKVVAEKTYSIKDEVIVGRPLYMDAQSTTSLDPRVLDAMLPYLTSYYGNPHSRTHAYGWESEAAVEKARAQIANIIGADPKEIIFTSGATESNNIAVKGVARFYGSKKKHVVTTQTVSEQFTAAMCN
jgi:cysteine desulfurase